MPELPLAEANLPETIGGWTQTKFEKEERGWESSFGRRSSIWNYQQSGQVARVSLDYYFENWHDLMICYIGIGWDIQERKLEPPESVDDPWHTVSLFMTDKSGNKALLCYTLFTIDGQPLESPVDTPRGLLFNRFGLLNSR